MEHHATYEEQFGPVARRIRRVARALGWLLKGLIGRRRSILVEVRWRLGDEIMALPIYDALRHRYPDAAIHVWATYPELLPGWVVSNERVEPDRYVLLRDAARDVNRLEHYARLAGVPVPEDVPMLEAHEESRDWTVQAGQRIVFAPGATWPTKRWPRERWEDLYERLAESGAEVVVLGNAGEGLEVGRDLTGQTTITHCARILAGADVTVCSDSGLMHLSLAVGTPVVALFGPTNPAMLVRNDTRLHAITNGRDCRFCWNDSQEMVEPGICPRHIAQCLGTIDAETVANQVRDALNAAVGDTARRS